MSRGAGRRRGRRAAGQPRAAQQPAVPRRAAARPRPALRPARRRRGALRLRLGPRLPARLPPHPRPAHRRCPPTPRCWPRPRPPTPGSSPTSSSSSAPAATTCSPCAAGWPATRCGSACCALTSPEQRLGLAARPPRRAAGQRHRLHPHRLGRRGRRGGPARGRSRGARLHRAHRPGRPRAARGRCCATTRSRRSWRPRRSAWASTSPTSASSLHLGAPSSPVAYYQQVGRAGRATERADVLLLPGPEDKDIWAYFASASMPRQEQADAVLTRPGRVEQGRCRPWPWSRSSTSGAPGSSCCSRCSTSTARSSGCRAAGPRPGSRGPTTPSATSGSPRPGCASRS